MELFGRSVNIFPSAVYNSFDFSQADESNFCLLAPFFTYLL